GLQEVRLRRVGEGAEYIQTDKRGTGRHTFDADVARGRIGLRAETIGAVDVDALAGNRVGVEEGLIAAGGLSRTVAAEVLVVDEYRGAVLADEIDIFGVEAVGDPRDFHSGTGDAQGAGGLG